MHERDIMKLKAIRPKNPQDWGEFKQLRNKVNSDIRILKESYYRQSFTENKNDSRRSQILYSFSVIVLESYYQKWFHFVSVWGPPVEKEF